MKAEEIEKNISLEYEITVTDKERKKLYEKREGVSKSYVKQFIQTLALLLSRNSLTMVDTGGANVSVPLQCSQSGYSGFTTFNANAGEGDDSMGIVVGASDIAVANDDHNLYDQIHHGTDSGQLYYGDMTFFDIMEADGYLKLPMLRTFYNGSGAAIDGKEIGFVTQIYCKATTYMIDYGYFLWIRDVLSPAVTVDAGKTLSVQYILKTKA